MKRASAWLLLTCALVETSTSSAAAQDGSAPDERAAPAPAPPPAPAPAPPLPPPPQIIVILPPPPETATSPAFEAPPPPFVVVPQPEPAPPRATSIFRVEGAATFSHIYNVPISGGELTIAIGKEARRVAVYGSLTFFGGVQETGLTAFHVRSTGDVEWKFGAFRLGAGLSLGELFLSRATTSEPTEAPTLGVVGLMSFDVVTWGERQTRSLYVEARIRADVAAGYDASPLYWGESFGLGVRY